MKTTCLGCLAPLILGFFCLGSLQASTWVTPFAISRQVNVDAQGQNIPGDAANEPSFCIDPTDPNRIAVGWRQFTNIVSDFRQAGWAYSTNGGLGWTFPGVLTPGVFRSDPVLVADADGNFYYFSLMNAPNFHCDLWRSTNGGRTWELRGDAYGGDKAWITCDTTPGPGRGNLYHFCTSYYTYSGNRDNMFTRSTNGGASWLTPMPIPRYPYWGTLDIGPGGELYVVGTDGTSFVVNRSTNAQHAAAVPVFDLTRSVSLSGSLLYGVEGINPAGLLGQVWIAADRSPGPTRGNVYLLSTVTGAGNPANVMFARSTDGGSTWSAPVRLNDNPENQGTYHWFGTLSLAPNGRLDACWYDTRNSFSNSTSELYYTWSEDGGLTWATNRALSPAFNQSLGYPVQRKIGDYIGMVSLNEGACIVYAATMNGEEDLYFARAELPIRAACQQVGGVPRISWNSSLGVTYCVQAKDALTTPWATATNVACVTAQGASTFVDDPAATGRSQRFYRVVRQ